MRAAKDKSELTQLLHKVFEPQYEEPNVQVKVIDGTTFVNIYRPRTSKTLGEYCDDDLVKAVYSFSKGADRMDFVFGRYLENSIKTQTREGRGKGMRILVRRDTPLCEDFKTFMRDSDNKAEVFLMIANSISQIKDVPTSIIATVNEKVIFNGFDIDFENIMPCNQEEADTRLILHVFDGCRKGYKKLTIVGSDTDIVVIALYHFYDLDVNELWIEYGVSKNKRWLPIHEYAKCLGEEICRALPFWYVITGCDTVSAFSGRGKKTAWDIWGISEEATRNFIK